MCQLIGFQETVAWEVAGNPHSSPVLRVGTGRGEGGTHLGVKLRGAPKNSVMKVNNILTQLKKNKS